MYREHKAALAQVHVHVDQEATKGPCTSCESVCCPRWQTSEDLPQLEKQAEGTIQGYPTVHLPALGQDELLLRASWQLFNLFLKMSDGGPTASLANLRWCLDRLTDGKSLIIFILVLSS